MLDKRIDDITTADLQAFLDEGVPEGQIVDYKLPGQPDPTGAAIALQLNDEGRRELAKDVVAFANAEGGWLIIGVNETATEPARPDGIVPILECERRAVTLRDSLANSIDPPLHGLRCRGIPTDGTSGVILVYVPASAGAPHAVTHSGGRKLCAVRRNDQSVTLTMPEITSLAVESVNRTERLRQLLESRRSAFDSFDVTGDDRNVPAAVYRISIVPVRPRASIPRIYGRLNLLATTSYVRVRWDDNSTINALALGANATHSPRPALLGAVIEGRGGTYAGRMIVGQDGMVETCVISPDRPQDGISKHLYVWWLVADLVNAMRVAHRLRTETGAGEAEMWLDVEIDVRPARGTVPAPDERFVVISFNERWHDHVRVPAPLRLPLQRILGPDTFNGVANELVERILNAGGMRWEHPPFTCDW